MNRLRVDSNADNKHSRSKSVFNNSKTILQTVAKKLKSSNLEVSKNNLAKK